MDIPKVIFLFDFSAQLCREWMDEKDHVDWHNDGQGIAKENLARDNAAYRTEVKKKSGHENTVDTCKSI